MQTKPYKYNDMNKFNLLLVSTVLGTMSAGAVAPRGVDRANLDPSVRPQDDFYDYACGGWMKANPLSDEFSRFGTFDQLAELNRSQVYELVTGLDASKATKGSNTQKIADLFALGMDSVRLNREGAAPLAADLAVIASTPREKVIELMATMPGIDAFFGTGVEADMMNSSMNEMYWQQGGLGMGDRDYYLEDSEHAKTVREAYKNYLLTVAKLAGYSEADAKRLVNNTMEIETALAKAAMSREELRDPAASYNPMTIAELATRYPSIDLRRYFSLQGINDIDHLIVGQPKSLAAVDSIIANASEQALRDYLAAGYISSAASFLGDDFINANFDFAKVRSGIKQM